MKRTADLILIATVEVKTAIDPVIPLLEMAAKEDPAFQPVYEAYARMQKDLAIARDALKVMI